MIRYRYIKDTKCASAERLSDGYIDIIPLIKTIKEKGKTKYILDEDPYSVEVVDYDKGTISLVDSDTWDKMVEFRKL